MQRSAHSFLHDKQKAPLRLPLEVTVALVGTPRSAARPAPGGVTFFSTRPSPGHPLLASGMRHGPLSARGPRRCALPPAPSAPEEHRTPPCTSDLPSSSPLLRPLPTPQAGTAAAASASASTPRASCAHRPLLPFPSPASSRYPPPPRACPPPPPNPPPPPPPPPTSAGLFPLRASPPPPPRLPRDRPARPPHLPSLPLHLPPPTANRPPVSSPVPCPPCPPGSWTSAWSSPTTSSTSPSSRPSNPPSEARPPDPPTTTAPLPTPSPPPLTQPATHPTNPLPPAAAAMAPAPARTYGTTDLPLSRAFDVDARRLEATFDRLYADFFASASASASAQLGQGAQRGKRHEPFVLFVLNPHKPAVARAGIRSFPPPDSRRPTSPRPPPPLPPQPRAPRPSRAPFQQTLT